MIRQDMQFTIQLSMEEYANSIKTINLSNSRRAMQNERALSHEVGSYRTMTEERIWLGCGALPQVAYFGSLMQQKIPHRTVAHITESNKTPSELGTLRPVITFQRPPGQVDFAEVVPFFDASSNISVKQQYGQTILSAGFATDRLTERQRLII